MLSVFYNVTLQYKCTELKNPSFFSQEIYGNIGTCIIPVILVGDFYFV